MAVSSVVVTATVAAAADYNNLRQDVLSTTLGHMHDGTNGREHGSGDLKVRNPADTFSYTIKTSAIVANRDATIPLLAANDTFAMVGTSTPFTADVQLNDNVKLILGTGSDTELYYDGTNTLWALQAVGTGGLMLGIGSSPPSPDISTVHIWKASAGSVTAPSGTVVTVENSGAAYLSFLKPDANEAGILIGEPTSASRAWFIYQGSADATPDTWQLATAGSVRLNVSANAFAFQEATTISTVSNLTLAAQVGNDVLIGDDVTILYVDGGTGGFGIGAASNADYLVAIGGSQAQGASGDPGALLINTAVTAGSSSNSYFVNVTGGSIAADGTNPIVASVRINEPNITIGGHTVTKGAALYVVGAPTEATNNFTAIFGDGGTGVLWVNDTNDSTDAAGGLIFGSSRDTNLYRSAANTLKTDDAFIPAGGLTDVAGVSGNIWSSASVVHKGTSGSKFERTGSATNSLVIVQDFKATTSANMVDGFGSIVRFINEDGGASDQVVGDLGFRRAGADNTGDFVLRTREAGVINEAFKVDSAGELYADLDGTGGSYLTNGVNLFDDYDDPLELQRYAYIQAPFISESERQTNRNRMMEMGIVERKRGGSGYGIKFQTLSRLLAGGIYQNRQRIDTYVEHAAGIFAGHESWMTEHDTRLNALDQAMDVAQTAWSSWTETADAKIERLEGELADVKAELAAIQN